MYVCVMFAGAVSRVVTCVCVCVCVCARVRACADRSGRISVVCEQVRDLHLVQRKCLTTMHFAAMNCFVFAATTKKKKPRQFCNDKTTLQGQTSPVFAATNISAAAKEQT